MNRRLRSPIKSSPSKIEEKLHRFLRPGALARLRDSRIIARSPRSNLRIPNPNTISLLSPPSSPAGTNGAHQIDGFPCFVARIYGPRFPQRKKLVASKPVFFIGSIPSSPVSLESDSIMELFNSDLVVAH